MTTKRLLIFGYGFTAAALVGRLPWRVGATSRKPETRSALAERDVEPLDPGDPPSLAAALINADAVLICAPPGEGGCPALRALEPVWRERDAPWIGYLSTTGVYGDRGGGWVREDTPVRPASREGERRVEAEAGWRRLADGRGAPLAVFRLPGIYGPGRSPLDRILAGDARRWTKPGHVFSRIHLDDLAAGLALALERQACGVFHVCDDEPAPASDVTAYACRLLGREPPPQEPLDPAALSPMARRFWSESKRVSNARAKAVLGWRPTYPTYREGLRMLARRADAGEAPNG